MFIKIKKNFMNTLGILRSTRKISRVFRLTYFYVDIINRVVFSHLRLAGGVEPIWDFINRRERRSEDDVELI